MKKFFWILIFFVAVSLFAKDIDYKKILNFEDLSYWKSHNAETGKTVKGFVPDTKIKIEGKQSALWDDPLEKTRIDLKTVEKDWSKYNAISFWVYSDNDEPFKFALIFESENQSTSGWDYYLKHINVTWKGWKKLVIPLSGFVIKRKPLGWNHIDRIRFASTGYVLDSTPPKGAKLRFDKFEPIKLTKDILKKRLNDIMGFEDLSAWPGLQKDKNHVKQGKYSGKWFHHDVTPRINCTDLPKDWSQYNALQFWAYSEKANNAGFEIVINSVNPKTKKDDYFRHGVVVDWTGWKKIVLPFDRFAQKYSPIGWNKIDRLRLAASGYGHTPKKDTVLYLDDLKLVNIEMVPVVTYRKHYFENNRYINYFKIPLKNVSRHSISYTIKLSKSLSDFDVKIRNKNHSLNPGEKINVEFYFKLKPGINKKTIDNKIPKEPVTIVFSTTNTKKKLSLNLYYPFLEGKQHPHVILTPSEIQDIRIKVKKYEWAKDAMAAMEKTAIRYSKGNPPAITGGDYHERYGKYAISAKHINFGRAARYYAILYAITGKKSYAEKSKSIFLKYLKVYPKLVRTDMAGNKGDSAALRAGKISVQLITDSKWDIFMADAYDLIYDLFTPEEHSKIEDIFRDQVEMIRKDKRGAHNFQAIYNAAISVIGYALHDPDYVDYALNDHSNGFIALQLKQSFTKDGFYYERSPHYHHFILSYLSYLFEAAYNSGFNIYKVKGVKNIYDTLLSIIDEEYEVPYFNDGGYFNATQTKRGWPYIQAYDRYKDKRYLWIIDTLSRTSPEALLYLPGKIYGEKSGQYAKKKYYGPYKSFLLPYTKWAFLRAQNSQLGDFYLSFKYDQYYSSHSHIDSLTYVVKAFKKFILPDAGSVKYGDPYQIPWFRNTFSHNTLLIDRKPHSLLTITKLNYFYDSACLQAVKATADGVLNHNTSFNRTLLLVDNSYVIDLVKAKDISGRKHSYDLVYHFIGEPQYRSFQPLKHKNIYTSAPYNIISDFGVYSSKNGQDIVADYKLSPDTFTRFWYKGPAHLKLITGAGLIADKHEHISKTRVPLIILRQDDSKASFVALIQPNSKKLQEQKITKFKKLMDDDLKQLLQVNHKDGSIDFIAVSKNGINKKDFFTDAKIGYLKIKDDQLLNFAIMDGKTIKYKDVSIQLNKKGQVALFYNKDTKKFSLSNQGNATVSVKIVANLGQRKSYSAQIKAKGTVEF